MVFLTRFLTRTLKEHELNTVEVVYKEHLK